MPRADRYMASLVPARANKATVRSKVLTPSESANLVQALRADACDLYYSAWVSFIDALNGIDKGFFTWATVKLYYSVYYSFRSSLSLDALCAFHIDHSSYTIKAKAGESPTSCTDRGTHKTILKTFERTNPSHQLISQQIDLTNATDWFIETREKANYGKPRFSEPDSEIEFTYISKNGIRKSLSEYISNTSIPYAFDPDHAIVAYPLLTLRIIGQQLNTFGPAFFDESEQAFLRRRSRDSSGTLNTILTELKRLTLIK